MGPARLLAVVFALSLACGLGAGRLVDSGSAPIVAASPTSSSTTAPTTATTTPPPRHVVLAGDSVMAGLVPAVRAALEPAATVDFVLTPAVLRDPSIRFTWSEEVAALEPDVVVMLVGTWEERTLPGVAGDATDPGSNAWSTAYRTDVVDPFIDLVTSSGASVVWIGAPSVASPDLSTFFGVLNMVYSGLPERWSEVRYVDPVTALGPSGAGYVDVVSLPDGTTARLRQIDGLHLCPVGAQLLAEEVAGTLAEELDIPLTDGWQQGDWVTDEDLYAPEGCPAPTPPGT